MKLNFINQNSGKTGIDEINERQVFMARLAGLLLTDGGLSQIGGKWRIHFTSNSRAFLQEFDSIVMQLFRLKTAREYRNGAWKAQAWVSRKVKEELLSYSPTYRTLNKNGKETEARIPDFIYNPELAKQFLKYAFTSDGTVIFNIGRTRYGFRFDRCVKLYCEHNSLRKQYYELLRKLNYETILLKDAVLIRKQKNLARFAQEIGFVEGVVISGKGLWTGIPKSQLLRFIINSYGLKPSELGKTKSDIHTNLIKLIPRPGYQMI